MTATFWGPHFPDAGGDATFWGPHFPDVGGEVEPEIPAHAFDTTLAKPQRTLVREAVIARLAPLLRSATPPGYLHAIRGLPRPLHGEGDDDGFAMLHHVLAGRAPSVAVALGRQAFTTAGLDATEARGELAVAIYVVSAHGRDLVDGRLAQDVVATGDLTADPGIEVVLEHVRERLLGQGLGVEGIAELRPTDEDVLATYEDMTVFEQNYTCATDVRVNPARDGVLITSIQGLHREDATADAEDGALDITPLETITELEEPDEEN